MNAGIKLLFIPPKANPFKETPWQEDASWEVVGLDPSPGKIFFYHEISVKAHFYNHLIVEIVNYIKVSCALHLLSHALMCEMYPEFE